jgi:hypothetical protein
MGGQVKAIGAHADETGKKVSSVTSGLKRMALGLGAVGAGYATWNAAKGAVL